MSEKPFMLIIEHVGGKLAFPVTNNDIQQALREYENARRMSVSMSVLHDKSFSFPTILSAEIVRTFQEKH